MKRGTKGRSGRRAGRIYEIPPNLGLRPDGASANFVPLSVFQTFRDYSLYEREEKAKLVQIDGN